MKLDELRRHHGRLCGRRDQVLHDIKGAQQKILYFEHHLREYEEADLIIKEASRITQEQLKYVIEPPVNEALAGVFDNPYQFEIQFKTAYGRTSVQQIFKRDDTEYKDLLFSGGGGPVDVAAFALQVAGLCLTSLRKLLLLDEPLKHLKSKTKVLEERGALMLQEISHQLGIQVIMISHIPEQQKGADRIFELKLKSGVTQEVV